MRPSLVLFSALSPIALVRTASLLPRADDDCGVVGYDKANPKAYYFRNDDPSVANFQGCKAACDQQSECVSFAVGDGSCLLYPSDISSNVRLDANSPYIFYSANCTAAVTVPGANAHALAISSAAASTSIATLSSAASPTGNTSAIGTTVPQSTAAATTITSARGTATPPSASSSSPLSASATPNSASTGVRTTLFFLPLLFLIYLSI